ncbi:MAG: DNA-binding protein [Clostridia bacterium]|nr:DNA-binding protein [Clostridia bacterium]
MFEKNLNVGYLLDFYGELLPERKRAVLDMYYNEDYSLAEIADEIGISRQGVRNIIKKTESELFFYEEKLGLAKKLMTVEKYSASLCRYAEEHELPEHIKNEILQLAEAVKQ